MSGTQPAPDDGTGNEVAPPGELNTFLEADFTWMNWADEVERLTLDEDVPKEQLPGARDAKDFQAIQHHVDLSKVPNSPPFMAIVLNLPFDTTEEDLARFFNGTEIAYVELVHQNDGNMVGASYVEFRDRQSLICALQRAGNSLNNRTIRVEVCTSSSKDRRTGDAHRRRGYLDGGKGSTASRGRRSSEMGSTRGDRQLFRRAQMPNDVRAADYPRRTNSVDQSTSERETRYDSLPRGIGGGRFGSHDAGVPPVPSQFAERQYDNFSRGGRPLNDGRRQELPYFRSLSKSESQNSSRTVHDGVSYKHGGSQLMPDVKHDRNLHVASDGRQRRSSAQSDSGWSLGSTFHSGRPSYGPLRQRGNYGGHAKFEQHYGSLNRNRMGQGWRPARINENYLSSNFVQTRLMESGSAEASRQQEAVRQPEDVIERNAREVPAEPTMQQERPLKSYSSIFGEAKPVDTERRVREIEQQRLALLQQQSLQNAPPRSVDDTRRLNDACGFSDNTICEQLADDDLFASGEIKLLKRPVPQAEATDTTGPSEIVQAAAPQGEGPKENETSKPTDGVNRPKGGRDGSDRRSRGHRGGRRNAGFGRGGYAGSYGGRSGRQDSRKQSGPPPTADNALPGLQAAPPSDHVSGHFANESIERRRNDGRIRGSTVGIEPRASSVSSGRGGGYRFEHIIEFRRGGTRKRR